MNRTALLISATNGPANGTCYLLSSTNLALPLSQWTRVLTNTFGSDGSFTNPIPINSSEAQRFYRLVAP